MIYGFKELENTPTMLVNYNTIQWDFGKKDLLSFFGDNFVNCGKNYYGLRHRGDPFFFEEKIALGGDNEMFREDLRNFYKDFMAGKYKKTDDTIDIEKLNKFGEELANKYDVNAYGIRWANLVDKGAFYHDLKGALLTYIASRTISAYLDENYKLRPENKPNFEKAVKTHWSYIIQSDKALIKYVDLVLKSGDYGIVYPDGKDKVYEYVFYNKGWYDEDKVKGYGKALVSLFSSTIKYWEKESIYPWVSKKEILERAVEYKKYQERMWGGIR